MHKYSYFYVVVQILNNSKPLLLLNFVPGFNQNNNVMEDKDLKWVYGTILSAPGMEEMVKLDFKVSRKVVLLLGEVIVRGLKAKGNGLPESVDPELLKELRTISEGFIGRAGMTELEKNLRQLS